MVVLPPVPPRPCPLQAPKRHHQAGHSHLLDGGAEAFRSSRPSVLDERVFQGNAFLVAGLMILTLLWFFLRAIPAGREPMMTGLLMALTALGCVLLTVSAALRRQVGELVIAILLFTLVWHLLCLPSFIFF